MFAKPQPEHEWFNDLIGNWEFTHDCDLGPDLPSSRATGKMTGRTLGGIWTILEATGDSDGGDEWTSIFTLGFDSQNKAFVGTFVASMMDYLSIYNGQKDANGRLVLNVEGPKFDGSGMTMYQDIFEIVNHDHWILRSQVLNDNGEWMPFMEGHHHRV